MKKLKFAHAEYIQSALAPDSWPDLKNLHGNTLAEIAIVGRSNVGKSSLLNHLFNNNKLAKVSSTPGKTNTLNFFNIDDEIVLVDLPGYGYAKVAKNIKNTWAGHLDLYFQSRKELSLVLLLLDIRRTPSPDDLAFFEWSAHAQKPLLVIFTKCDKVTAEEKKKNSTLILQSKPLPHCFYSIKDPHARKELITTLNQVLDPFKFERGL